jgi:hypothetical protein
MQCLQLDTPEAGDLYSDSHENLKANVKHTQICWFEWVSNLSLTLREEHSLGVPENRVLRRILVL